MTRSPAATWTFLRSVAFRTALPLLLVARSAHAQEEPPADPAQDTTDDSIADGDAAGVDDAAAAEPTDTAGSDTVDSEEAELDGSFDADASASDEGTLTVSQGGGLFESAAAGESIDESVASEGVSLDWGGYVRGDVFVGGPAEGSSAPSINAAYAELSVQPRVTAGSWGSAFADFRMRYGQQLDEKKLFLDLREAYASAYLGPFELRLGKQVVVWGRADAFNPTSNIAPVDFRIRSPIEDDRRLGTVGARAFLNFEPVKLEGVWMPLYDATVLPPLDLEPYVRFVDPYYPSTSVQSGLLAAKAHLELSAFEASLSYLQGYAPLPGIELATGPDDPGFVLRPDGDPRENEVRVRRRAYRQHVIGADFAATPGGWFGLRGEAAYRLPMDYKNQPWSARPDIQWVLGIDKEFGQVMIIAQYLGKYTLDWLEEEPLDESLTFPDLVQRQEGVAESGIEATLINTNRMLFNQLHRLQSLVSGRIEWKTLHDSLSISALGLYNINTREWLAAPKVGYNITGGLTAYVGAEILGGPDRTLFGVISDTLTAGYVELRMAF